jgi:predicted permease
VDLDPHPIELVQQLLDELRTLPSVASVSVSTHTPLSGSIWSEPAVPIGQPLPERDTAVFVGAGPRFFSTMQIALLSGREFTEADSAESAGVAVVSRMFAERHFARQNPLGQHLSAKVRGRTRDLEIVGVVADVKAVALRTAPPPAVYVAYAQLGGANFPVYPTIEIRSSGAAAPLVISVRQALQRRLPDATIDVRSFSAQVDATLVQERMMAALGGAFGLLALVVATVGIYGLLAYSVVTRTREMGIRVALGARRRQVVAHVIGGAARLVILGVIAGVLMAWAISRSVESMLFEIKPTNPAAIAGAVGLLIGAALLAAWLPAERAARTDPLIALRHE